MAPDMNAIEEVLSGVNFKAVSDPIIPINSSPLNLGATIFVDITFETYADFNKAKSIIEIMGEGFKVLGEYKNAKL